MESNSKKHIIAERILDNGISLKLCNLFVSEISDFTVLSAYSSLSKQLVAYKVLNSADAMQDQWLSEAMFNEGYKVGFNPDFELVPNKLSQALNPLNDDFKIHENVGHTELHLLYGIDKWMKDIKGKKVFVFGRHDVIAIVVYRDGQCLFANSFSYSDQTEILYFIINAIQISDLKQEDMELVLDYYCAHKFGLIEFFTPYFTSVKSLQIPFENPDSEILDLDQLLMPNHLGALCV